MLTESQVSLRSDVLRHSRRCCLVFWSQSDPKNVFEQLTLADVSSARRRPASGEVSISECNVTWRTVMVELLSSGTNYPRVISRNFSSFLF